MHRSVRRGSCASEDAPPTPPSFRACLPRLILTSLRQGLYTLSERCLMGFWTFFFTLATNILSAGCPHLPVCTPSPAQPSHHFAHIHGFHYLRGRDWWIQTACIFPETLRTSTLHVSIHPIFFNPDGQVSILVPNYISVHQLCCYPHHIFDLPKFPYISTNFQIDWGQTYFSL